MPSSMTVQSFVVDETTTGNWAMARSQTATRRRRPSRLADRPSPSQGVISPYVHSSTTGLSPAGDETTRDSRAGARTNGDLSTDTGVDPSTPGGSRWCIGHYMVWPSLATASHAGK